MEWVETTGSTVAAAIEKAIERLGVSQADAEIVVLEEPRSSIFGLRKSEARIRARVRPVQARAKRPARRSQQGDSRRRGSSDGRGQQRNSGGRRDSQKASASSEKRPAETSEQAADETGGERPAGQKAASGNRSGRSGSRNRGRRSGAAQGDRAQKTRETAATEEEQMSIESQAELAEEFVRGVVRSFGLEADLTKTLEDETVRIEVNGENLGLLIGPRGATVDALQELTRTAVQRRGEDMSVRLVVDVGGYRVRRAAALQQFARRVAGEVIESGEPQALDPMSAADRKIVHDTVNELGTVHTTSEGQDPRRYVVIHPGGATERPASSSDAG
jgi:spoIIIJ-associated protein